MKSFEELTDRTEVLLGDKADELRRLYIDRFVDTSKTYFQERIRVRRLFKDGFLYTGYLWDCLKRWERITEVNLMDELMHHEPPVSRSTRRSV